MQKQNNEALHYLLYNGSKNSKTKGENVSTSVISQLTFEINEITQHLIIPRKNNKHSTNIYIELPRK